VVTPSGTLTSNVNFQVLPKICGSCALYPSSLAPVVRVLSARDIILNMFSRDALMQWRLEANITEDKDERQT